MNYNSKKITLDVIVNYVLNINKNKLSDDFYEENQNSEDFYDDENNDLSLIDLDDSKNINSLPEPFYNITSELNSEKIFRIGSKHKSLINNKKCNTSLYWSFLNCIIEKFNEKSVEERIELINRLVLKIVYDINTTNIYKNNKYITFGWKKNTLIKNIQTCNLPDMVIKFLSDYFNLNIFILNLKKGIIESSYKEDYLNKFKKNIFLIKINDDYEPILCNNKCLFDYNDLIFNVIISHNKNLVKCINIDYSSRRSIKIFTIGSENLDNYIREEYVNENNLENNYDELIDNNENKINNVIDINDSIDTDIDIHNQSEDIFYKKEKEIDNFEIKSINIKMKLKELQDIAKKLKIDIYSNNKTKKGTFKLKTKMILYDSIVKLLT